MKYYNKASNLFLIKLLLKFALVVIVVLPSCTVRAQFSSNVVALTSKNWQKEVIDSPHGVFINICRNG